MQQIEPGSMSDEASQMIEDVIKSLTDEWVETFSKPENQNGFMRIMADAGNMPEGVDQTDKRVIELCQKAKEYYLARKQICNLL